MKLLVIPEDPTLDAYILKPLVERLCHEAGLKNTRIDVLRDPHLRGIDQALEPAGVRAILDDNPMVDLFLIVVDRDCDRQQSSARAAAREAEHPDRLLTAVAVEELEVWMLALHKDALPTRWSEIRAECDPKEVYAETFLRASGWSTALGRGRVAAMRGLAGKRWTSLSGLCPELGELLDRPRAWSRRRSGG